MVFTRALVSPRPLQLILIGNDTVNKYGSVDSACANMAGKPIVCHSHKRTICPECKVGCEKYECSVIEIGQGRTLHVADGEEVYAVKGGIQNGTLFSWCPRDDDDSRLDALQSPITPYAVEIPNLALNFGWTTRFIPQWDEQVQGVKIWHDGHRIKHVKFKPPIPSPPDQLDTTYCEECQLTWITGDTDTHEHRHPTHDALCSQDTRPYMLDQRSIVIYIDGDNYNRGQGRRNGVGRLGVYFGQGSKYNHSEPIYLTAESSTKRCAEIHAARHALLIVKEAVIPDYMARIKKQEQSSSSHSPSHDKADHLGATTTRGPPKSYHVERPFELQPASEDSVQWSEESSINSGYYQDIDIRVVLATDSTNLVDLFCDQIVNWIYDEEAQEFRRPRKRGTKKGEVVKNNDIISDFHNELSELAGAAVGISVCWYHVPSRFNSEARKLADTTMDC